MSVSEAELVLDDELMFDDAPRRSTRLRRGDERPDQLVREGEVLAGKYRVERIPGRSGLGVVVQVRHLELGQEVTLKFLVPDACAYPEFVQRFVREARAAVKIQGEHVARVTDVGRLESGAPYMVREYLRGPDLAEVLKVRGPLPFEEAVDFVIQACEGVAEGHALGVVHRNLRPTSLVVTRRSDGMPLVKVFDFAAAESLHVDPFTERAVSLVGTSAIMASLPYLAPEQIRDPHDVDARADVYSLGAILFELLAGQPVYAADSAPALLAMVAADSAPPLRTLRPDTPGGLDHVVLRCLAKNRAIRYPGVAELVLALKEFATDEALGSIERVVRLGKRTSKPPELGSSPARSLPLPVAGAPIAAAPVVSVAPAGPAAPFLPSPSALPAAPAIRASVPPLRTSVPPPLRAAATPLPAAPQRTSIPSMTRSWAVPDVPTEPLFTKKRLVAVGVVAAFATLGAVFAVRSARPSAPVAAAAPVKALPAPLPPPAPEPAPPPAPEASIAAAAPSAAPSAAASAAAPAPAPAPVAAAPVAAPALVLRPAPVARPANLPKRTPKTESDAPTRTVAAADKVARVQPAAGPDLFEDPR